MKWLCTLDITNWIEIVALVINSILAFWIVRTIQNRLTNKRVLKDHFINEIKDIRQEYRNWLSNLYSNKVHPRTVTPWFKLMNIRVNDLIELLHSKYLIEKQALKPFQIDLQELITNNADFEKQFRNDKPIVFSDESKIKLIKFQQNNNHIFNNLIIKINDSN